MEKGMLILTRKPGEVILVGDNIEVVFMGWHGLNQAKIAIRCPKETKILRGELAGKSKDKDWNPAHPSNWRETTAEKAERITRRIK